MHWISWGGGLLIGAILGGLFGLFFGVGFGDLNADIDFCADGTSPRYIYAEDVRKNVC